MRRPFIGQRVTLTDMPEAGVWSITAWWEDREWAVLTPANDAARTIGSLDPCGIVMVRERDVSPYHHQQETLL